MKVPALIASTHVSLTGNPATARRYGIVCGIDGKLYTLFAFFLVTFAPLENWRFAGCNGECTFFVNAYSFFTWIEYYSVRFF
jgi:hypothetical protein